jgi:hypothetical protein
VEYKRQFIFMERKFWQKWTIYCAFGELLGIGVAGAIAYTANLLIGEPIELGDKLIVLFAMLIAGAIEGGLLGYFQWKVLVEKFAHIPKKEWLKVTMIIAVLGWFLGMMPSLFFIDPAYSNTSEAASLDFSNPMLIVAMTLSLGLLLGAFFGLFQWFSLRKYADKAYIWILANALGWSVGMGWIFLFASLPTEESGMAFSTFAGIMGGLLAGLSVGAITGAFLLRLIPKKLLAVQSRVA